MENKPFHCEVEVTEIHDSQGDSVDTTSHPVTLESPESPDADIPSDAVTLESPELPDGDIPSEGEVSGLAAGLFFVSVFRWALIVFFGFLIKAQFETALIRACNATHCTELGLSLLPPGIVELGRSVDGSWSSIWNVVKYAWSTLHWPFLTGLVQALITAIFAIRYTLCIVDPIERRAGLLGERSASVPVLDEEVIQSRLGSTRAVLVAVVVFAIGMPELMFLFHAASSVTFDQWTVFLLSLVLWDSGMFFIVLPIFFSDRRKKKREKQVTGELKDIAAQGLALSLLRMHRPPGSEASDLTEQERKLELRREELIQEGQIEGLGSAVNRYRLWNFLDVVAILGFCATHYFVLHDHTVTDGQNWWNLVLLLVFFLGICLASFANYKMDPSTWQTHLTVIRLARVPSGKVKLPAPA